MSIYLFSILLAERARADQVQDRSADVQSSAWVDATVPAGPLVFVADQPGRRTLCFASSSSLLVSSVRLSTVGSRVFLVVGYRVWNILPEETISASPLTIFCQRLKTWHFRQSYPDLII